MTSVQHAIAYLQQQGVQWIATLCGHGLDPFFHAASQAGLRLIDTRNEQTAAYIAESYGRLTRKPGVCAVSAGIAHINALTGVANAWFGDAPMLLISGSHAHRTAGIGHFQDMDQIGTAAPITCYSRSIDHPDRTVQIFAEAFAHAAHGPAHITFPMDIQTAEPADLHPPILSPRQVAASDDIEDIAASLAEAERPLIIGGSGIHYNNEGDALIRFCEEYAIPLVIPIWDRGFISRPTEIFQGVLGAATGGPRLLPDADLVIFAGARQDYRTGYHPDALHLSSGWDKLRNDYSGKSHTEWLHEAQRRRREFRARIHGESTDKLHSAELMTILKPFLTPDTALVIDGGSIGQWAHQVLTNRYPAHWLTCGPSGVVGFGIGGAMAARLANPDRPVILLSGDGAFTFNVADLECAVRQKLPFVAVVADDMGWGITKLGHIRQYGEAIASSLGPIAFDQLAMSLGARGVQATTAEQVRDALTAALASTEVTVIHVPIVGGNP